MSLWKKDVWFIIKSLFKKNRKKGVKKRMNNGHNGLDSTSQEIIDYISKNLNNDGLCTHSKGAISKTIGVSQKTVQRKIQELTASGKILIIKIGANSNGYKINDDGDSHSHEEVVISDSEMEDKPHTDVEPLIPNKVEDYEKTVFSVSDALLRRGLTADEKFIREHLPCKDWDRKKFEPFKKKLIERLTAALKSPVKNEDAALFICWNWAVLKRLFPDEWVEGFDIRKIVNPSGENRGTSRLVRLLIFCETACDSSCPNCNGSGYSGRSAIAEVMVVDDEIRPYLIKEDINGLRKHLQAAGFRSLKDDAVERVISWHTSIQEIRRIGIIFEEK
jgi:DNA-binding Lrp family transcriptional regulator